MNQNTIVVVDDDPAIRRLLTRLFSPQYAVTPASGGAQALRLISRRRPDLVFLDIGMPGLGGLATLEAYRKTYPSLATIVLTGSLELDVARRALELGVRAYITKPFDTTALMEDVRRIFNPLPA